MTKGPLEGSFPVKHISPIVRLPAVLVLRLHMALAGNVTNLLRCSLPVVPLTLLAAQTPATSTPPFP